MKLLDKKMISDMNNTELMWICFLWGVSVRLLF